MNGNTVVPQEIFNTLRGKDITVCFKLAEGIEWEINGKDIGAGTSNPVGDVNLAVKLNSSNISADQLEKLPSVDNNSLQISLIHEGSLGFAATLHINLKKENQEKTAYLYYYDPAAKEFKLQGISQIDKNGTTDFRFIHASDYIITVDDGSVFTELMSQIKFSCREQTLYIGGNSGKTSDISVELPIELQSMINEGGMQYEVTYTSNDPGRASVSSSGKITALSQGKTTVATIVTINGVKKTFTTDISIKKAYIQITKKITSMKLGKTYTYQAKGYGVDASTLTWATIKKSIVVMNKKTGKATAKAAGIDYVVVKAGNIRAKVKVIVK
jgi:hypothetical protein